MKFYKSQAQQTQKQSIRSTGIQRENDLVKTVEASEMWFVRKTSKTPLSLSNKMCSETDSIIKIRLLMLCSDDRIK